LSAELARVGALGEVVGAWPTPDVKKGRNEHEGHEQCAEELEPNGSFSRDLGKALP
jgi:hypothetical protein